MARALSETDLRSWMERLGPRLIGLSAGICRDRHRAEEIVQEAFVLLWRRPPEVGEAAYPSWLRRVVTNLSINALKRTRRPAPLPECDPPARVAAADTSADQREQMERVRAALERLEEPKRVIIMLRVSEQLSYQEIAEVLSIPVGTVMSRLNRARAALAEELERRPEPAEAPPVYSFRKYESA